MNNRNERELLVETGRELLEKNMVQEPGAIPAAGWTMNTALSHPAVWITCRLQKKISFCWI